MKYLLRSTLVFLCVAMLSTFATQAMAQSSIGGGVHYLRTVGDIENDDNFDEDSLSYWVTFQVALADLLKLEADLEAVLDYGGSDEILWQPQAYVILGSWIYAGAGVGWGYLDGEWSDDPFYGFRAGLDLPLSDDVHLDINGNYRFIDSDVLDDINEDDADSITFGAFLRFMLGS